MTRTLGRLLIGAALALLPSAALACTCDDPAQLSPEQFENDLKLITRQQLHIGRVMRVDFALPNQARRYKVIEDMTGNLPGEIVIWPALARLPDGSFIEGPPPTSCDFSGEPGKVIFMAFIASRGRLEPAPCGVLGTVNDSGLRPAGLCTNGLLELPALRGRLIAAARAQAGVSRSSRPLSSSR